jgi:2'-hydroxyisoflavone reductase
MDFLLLGGTQFIGRHIAVELLRSGHRVTIFTRGRTPDDLPPSVERIHGDRNEGLDGIGGLSARSWDACVDVSGYTPRQVRPSVELLESRVSRYLFISTVSVYEDTAAPVRESQRLLPEAPEDVTQVTRETYGRLKVTCERLVRDAFGDRCTILRPQIVAGAHDPTGRHTYWVQRAMQGGDVLAPGDGSDHVQVVDVGDIARFARMALETGTAGIFNMSGPRLTWRSFIEALGIVSAVWVPADLLEAAAVSLAELPLFLPDSSPNSGLMHVSHERAATAGFTVTDAAETIAAVRVWLKDHPVTPPLSSDRERELIRLARDRQSAG